MKELIIAAGLAAFAFSGGRLLYKHSFNNKVKKLFNRQTSLIVSNKATTQLPAPVERYFKKALNGNTVQITSARLKHNGFFKTSLDKNWGRITGEQYYTALVPGFVWKGTTGMFSATDSFTEGRGNLSVWLFSAFKLISRSGNTMDQAELLRWLGEAILFPSALVENDFITWRYIDEISARLEMFYNGICIYYTVYFNDKHEINRMETERYDGNGNLVKWIGRFKDYKNISGYHVPTTMEGGWILDDVEYPYAKFYITALEYNNPVLF